MYFFPLFAVIILFSKSGSIFLLIPSIWSFNSGFKTGLDLWNAVLNSSQLCPFAFFLERPPFCLTQFDAWLDNSIPRLFVRLPISINNLLPSIEFNKPGVISFKNCLSPSEIAPLKLERPSNTNFPLIPDKVSAASDRDWETNY